MLILNQPWQACILPTKLTFTVVLWQNGLLLLLHLPIVPVKVLKPYFEAVACLEQKSRMESRRHFGREPTMVNVSYTKQQIDWLCQNSESWVIAFAHLKERLITVSNTHLTLPTTK